MKKCPNCKEKELYKEFIDCPNCGGCEVWECACCLCQFKVGKRNGVGEEL